MIKNQAWGVLLRDVMHPITITALFTLQCFHVLFLANAFLPARNGIRPNTLHVTLHLACIGSA